MNCATFMAGWVELATGVDHLATLRGGIATRDDAYSALSPGTLATALEERFGEPVHPSRAQRGDLAYRADDDAGGIFFTSGGRSLAFFLTDGGFSCYKFREVDLCFRVADRCDGWARKLNEYMLEAQARYKASGFSWEI